MTPEDIQQHPFFSKSILEAKRKSGIYQIKFVLGEMVYIGHSIDLYKRAKDHFLYLEKNIRKENILLQMAWNKYGSYAFTCEVLELVENTSDLTNREQFYFDQYINNGMWNKTYNICKKSTSRLGTKQSEEARKKQSIATKGRPKSEEWKQKNRKPRSEEYK